jgi:Co/Zn/Cd efflux system component
MSCDCHLEPDTAVQKFVLKRLLIINGVMFGFELIVGLIADSSGVIADSIDMLADCLVYGVSLFAVGAANSVKIGAARASGWFQIALAASILIDVCRRAVFGSEPSSVLMFGVSVVALAANAYCLVLLSRQKNREVHIQASWIFTRSDVVANSGIILAAIVVFLSQSRWPDLIVGAGISLFVLYGGISILIDAKREAEQAAAPQLDPTPRRKAISDSEH